MAKQELPDELEPDDKELIKQKPEEVGMDWMMVSELAELEHARKIRNAIIDRGGRLDPALNVKALNYMTHYFMVNSERLGRYEAMQREFFADRLNEDPSLSVSKAEAIAKGSEFGKKRVFYEHLCAGYQEMINTLKKTQEAWQYEAKNLT